MQAFLATNEIIWNLFSAALIGAVAGGIVAGLLIWRMRKKLAKDQQSHDQQRDKLLKEFEQDCNKRQSAWILFQELEAFAGCILEADQYASCALFREPDRQDRDSLATEQPPAKQQRSR